MKITVNGIRYDLSTMINLDIKQRERNGVSIEAVYFGPKSHRIIIESYSIWQRGQSDCCVGTVYDVIEPDHDLYYWTDRAQWAYDQSGNDAIRNAMDLRSPAMTD